MLSTAYVLFSFSALVLAVAHLIATQDSVYRIMHPLFNKSGYMLVFVNAIFCTVRMARSALIRLVFGDIRILESEVRLIIMLTEVAHAQEVLAHRQSYHPIPPVHARRTAAVHQLLDHSYCSSQIAVVFFLFLWYHLELHVLMCQRLKYVAKHIIGVTQS